MRRAAWLLVLGVLGAVVGVASAHASGAGDTTTSGTATTTATTTPSYAPLAISSLPAGCVGAGAAAIAPPSHPVVALGTPAADLGPSGYPASASLVAFSSLSVSGSTCTNTSLTLASVSLFQGAVTASSVEATEGKGAVAGLEIGGTAVSATAGQTVPVESWGQLTLGETAGRLAAPVVLRLLQAHDGLLAGTRIFIAFSAKPQPIAKPSRKHPLAGAHSTRKPPAHSRRHAKNAGRKKKQRRQPQEPPPDFPASRSPFAADGGLTEAVQDNLVVSTAMRYLGVRYQWGGARPSTGFDCSGLVKYVFGRLGVPLAHYAAAQYHAPNGVWVAPNQLRPGDLVFFTGSDGTRRAPGHVGIYVEDGYFIDAPHTGSLVRIDNLDEPKFANQYVGARQIVARLLVARHLSHVTKPDAAATTFPLGLPLPITISPRGESLGAAAGTATIRAASRHYWIWAGVALAAAVLLLVGAAFTIRRRHQPHEAISGNEAST